MADLARNATFSAGAVAWLQKPISGETLESAWSTILGPIPEAPGLEDLDELYPDRIQIEEDAGPLALPLPLPALGGLPPLGELPDLPVVVPVESETAKPKKGKKRLLVLIIIGAIVGAAGYAYQQGMLPV
jgi:hypothetical protein